MRCHNLVDDVFIIGRMAVPGKHIQPSGVPLLPTQMVDHNLMYNVWTIGGARILFRCRVHGYMPDASARKVCYDIT